MTFRQWRWKIGDRLPGWARWAVTVVVAVTIPIWFPVLLIGEFLQHVYDNIWN